MWATPRACLGEENRVCAHRACVVWPRDPCVFAGRRADIGAAYGTAKSGVGIASMGVMKPNLVMRNIIPVGEIAREGRPAKPTKLSVARCCAWFGGALTWFVCVTGYHGGRAGYLRAHRGRDPEWKQ